jgi:hypothetical protein
MGCVSVPNDTEEIIFRLTNTDAEGMAQTTRVENEVAIIALASAAFTGSECHVVPSVYAWGSAAIESSQSWIIQELMPVAPLDESFGAIEIEQKRENFPQMAQLSKALQEYDLPTNITSFGGMTFDDNGHIVSSAMTSVGVGPWPTYESSFKGRLEVAIQKADANPYIKGWRSNGVRERLDAFVERGLSAQFEDLDSKQDRVVVHADFSELSTAS